MVRRSASISAILGWLVGVAVFGVLYVVLPPLKPEQPEPYWAMAADKIGDAMLAVLPGLIAGYLAGRSGFRVGAVSGILTTLTVFFASAASTWPSLTLESPVTTTFFVKAVSITIAALITNGVSGLAGVYIHQSLPSNRTVDSDARGSGARGSS